MALKIEMLRCFCIVAQTGTLAEAAHRLGRTQSALSMTLKQMEAHLGQNLFEKERKNRLSPLGMQIFDLAQRQLRQYDETLQAIETSAKAPQGLIRIASIPSVAGLVFPHVIGQMAQRYPKLKIGLRDTDTPQVIDALLRGQADIGIASGQRTLNGISNQLLFQDRFGLICAPDHPLAHAQAPLCLADIMQYGLIKNTLSDQITAPEFVGMAEHSTVSVHNILSLIAMVRTRQWVTILPKTVTQLMPQELAFCPISDLTAKRDVVLFLREASPFAILATEMSQLITQFDWPDVSV